MKLSRLEAVVRALSGNGEAVVPLETLRGYLRTRDPELAEFRRAAESLAAREATLADDDPALPWF